MFNTRYSRNRSAVWPPTPNVGHLTSGFWTLPSQISCLTSHVSHLLSPYSILNCFPICGMPLSRLDMPNPINLIGIFKGSWSSSSFANLFISASERWSARLLLLVCRVKSINLSFKVMVLPLNLFLLILRSSSVMSFSSATCISLGAKRSFSNVVSTLKDFLFLCGWTSLRWMPLTIS